MAPLPRSIEPMKAVLGDGLPHDDPDDPQWTYELKWDGMRVLAYVDPAADPPVRLESSNQRDVTASFPELAALVDATGGRTAVFDGEVVAFADGRPSFGRLQQRMHLTGAAEVALRRAEVPVLYEVFDLLHFDGHDTTPLPYEPGKRTPNWRKVKVRWDQELVVGGWLAGEGNRSGRLGALLVGYHDPDAPGRPLRYAGRVGTGFTEAELHRLGALLDARGGDICPFDPPPPRPVARVAHWVSPDLVVQVSFGEWTSDGILRHPAYQGQREDKAAAEVVRELPS